MSDAAIDFDKEMVGTVAVTEKDALDLEALAEENFKEEAKALEDDLKAKAAEELAQPGVILSALAERLEGKDTPYAAPMRILADLAGAGGTATRCI